jgi:hypothetical protein
MVMLLASKENHRGQDLYPAFHLFSHPQCPTRFETTNQYCIHEKLVRPFHPATFIRQPFLLGDFHQVSFPG